MQVHKFNDYCRYQIGDKVKLKYGNYRQVVDIKSIHYIRTKTTEFKLLLSKYEYNINNIENLNEEKLCNCKWYKISDVLKYDRSIQDKTLEELNGIKTISTGEPSTLGTYRKIALILNGFNEQSKGVRFFDMKIKDSKNGENEIVIADERQMLEIIFELRKQE